MLCLKTSAKHTFQMFSVTTSDPSLLVASIGSIDEAGTLNGFFRAGFTLRKALLELVANSLDAEAQLVLFKMGEGFVRLIDDGLGMTIQQATDMMSLRKQNHKGRQTRGVSGIGLKPSTALLSKKRLVRIYTRAKEGDFLCIEIPWDIIFTELIYSGRVVLRRMTEGEKTTYLSERTVSHGTTTHFPSSDEMREAIIDNFRPIKEASCKISLDRIGVVFGEQPNFVCKLQEFDHPPRTISLYDYFSEDDSHFYCGKSVTILSQWNHASNSDMPPRFIMETEPRKEIVKDGRGFGKKPQRFSKNLEDYERTGEFTVTVGMRRNRFLQFKEDDPAMPKAEDTPSQYEREYLGEDNEDTYHFRASNKIIRNKQLIGTFESPDYAIGSARAKGDAMVRHVLVQASVSYAPTSEQNNLQDHAVGIQENKNQLSGKDIPVQLTRLVKYLKEAKGTEILEEFAKAVTVVSVPASVSQSAPESASETAPESASETAPETAPETALESALELAPESAPGSLPASPPDSLPVSPATTVPLPTEEPPTISITEVVPETQVSVIQEYASPHETIQPHPIRPVDVVAHRRGIVELRELTARWSALEERAIALPELSGPYVELFNLMGDILNATH